MVRTLLVPLLLVPGLLFGQYNRPGSTDAQFLKIGVSPRATALADAYIAVVRGAEATYYNAAAMPWVKGTDMVFNHTVWFAGIKHEFAAATHNFEELGTLGLSVTALYTDKMAVRTPLQPDGTGETFYAGNYRFGLSYARFLTDRVSFGATFSYIRMALYDRFSVDAFSIDISTLYVSDFRGFRFGMQIANFGSEVQYVNEAYPLPTNFTFGLGMNAIDGDSQKLLVTGAAIKPNEGEPLAQVGLEWNYENMFFLRGGRRFNYSAATWSFGGGFALDLAGYGVRADYSYGTYTVLGGAHRFGLGISF